MLHGVRFLQSQLHARVAEFSLKEFSIKEWLATFTEHEPNNVNMANHARKAHRDAKLHCFLSGLAVAVEGHLPARGLVLVAAGQLDFALRVLSSIAPICNPGGYESERITSKPSVHLLQNAALALTQGLLVAWPARVVARAHTEELVRFAGNLELPIVGATVAENTRERGSDPLEVLFARRDVLVTIGNPLGVDQAEAFVATERARTTIEGRSERHHQDREWKPAEALLS